MNGYIALYKGKQIEVYANTSYEAQQKASAQFKAKKSYLMRYQFTYANYRVNKLSPL